MNVPKEMQCKGCGLELEIEDDSLDSIIDFLKRVSSARIWDGQLQNFKAEAQQILKTIKTQ